MHDAHVRLYRARHPGNPLTVMRAYRQYLLARKREFCGQLPPPRRAHRSLIHYSGMIDSYLLAKRTVCRA
jgi:hypothetical protein